jgi:hypothetical protein
VAQIRPGMLVLFDAQSFIGYYCFAGWSSLVARRAHNPEVVSSNLTPATSHHPKYYQGLAEIW